jgi:hypothetical protein
MVLQNIPIALWVTATMWDDMIGRTSSNLVLMFTHGVPLLLLPSAEPG